MKWRVHQDQCRVDMPWTVHSEPCSCWCHRTNIIKLAWRWFIYDSPWWVVVPATMAGLAALSTLVVIGAFTLVEWVLL